MPRTPQPRVNTLTWNVPITTPENYPTPEFMRAWAQQQTIFANVPFDAASLSKQLDLLGKTPGDILVRGATTWVAEPVSGDATLSTAGKLTVTGLQGTPVTATHPSNGNILVYDSVSGTWILGTITGNDPVSSFFIDDAGNYYVAMVNSATDPRLIIDSGGLPVYVKNPAFLVNDPTVKPGTLARVFIGF